MLHIVTAHKGCLPDNILLSLTISPFLPYAQPYLGVLKKRVFQQPVRIVDILEAVQDTLEITRGMEYETFHQDKKTLKAVLYNLAVIGEAARKLPEEVAARYTSIPWREMGDMRNVVIHEYFGIDTKILWETVKNELPPIETLLKDILVDCGDL